MKTAKTWFWGLIIVLCIGGLLSALMRIPTSEENQTGHRPEGLVSVKDPYSPFRPFFRPEPSAAGSTAASLIQSVPEEGIRVMLSLSSAAAALQESTSPLPDYVMAAAGDAAHRILSRQCDNLIIFPFITDAHCGYYTDPSNSAVTLAGQLLKEIGTRVPYSFVANGGDYSTGAWNTTREDTASHIEAYFRLLHLEELSVPCVWAPGNHDDAPYQETALRLTQEDTFSLIGMRNRESGVTGPDGCNYGYLDLEQHRLRVIALDTDDKRSWNTVQVGAGQPGPDFLNAHNIGPEQLSWLANVALDFSDKAQPEDWSVIVLSHVPLNISGWFSDSTGGPGAFHSTAVAAEILQAYKNRKSGVLTHGEEQIPYDYTGISPAEIICMVHGHNHCFTSGQINGILSIGCPNAMNGREKRSSDGNIYSKIPDTAEGTSFCILSVDTAGRRIYADCVGAGFHREFTY